MLRRPAADPIAVRGRAATLASRAPLRRDSRSQAARTRFGMRKSLGHISRISIEHSARSLFGDPCLDRPYEILRPIPFRGENESFAQSIEAQHGSGARIGELDLVPELLQVDREFGPRHGANSLHPP